MNFIPYMRIGSMTRNGAKTTFDQFSRYLAFDMQLPDGNNHTMEECDSKAMNFHSHWAIYLHLCPKQDLYRSAKFNKSITS